MSANHSDCRCTIRRNRGPVTGSRYTTINKYNHIKQREDSRQLRTRSVTCRDFHVEWRRRCKERRCVRADACPFDETRVVLVVARTSRQHDQHWPESIHHLFDQRLHVYRVTAKKLAASEPTRNSVQNSSIILDFKIKFEFKSSTGILSIGIWYAMRDNLWRHQLLCYKLCCEESTRIWSNRNQ